MGMTTQQQLVIDQCKRNYDDLNRTGEHLDHKAMFVIVASILLFGASGDVFVPLAFGVAARLPHASISGWAMAIGTPFSTCISAWKPTTPSIKCYLISAMQSPSMLPATKIKRGL